MCGTKIRDIDPYYQRQKCRRMILVSGNVRFMGTFVWVPLGRGRQVRVGWSTTAIFGDFGYFFGIFRDKASSIIWRHATPCRQVTDCKMNELE